MVDDLTIDKGKIVRTITALKKQLDEYAPRRVSEPAKRDRIVKMRKELEHKFVDYLETFRDLNTMSRNDPNWTQAYQKAIDRPKVEHFITEWRKLGLLLEPEDPNINNLDKLRKAV